MVLYEYKDIDIKTDDFRVEAEFFKILGSCKDDLISIFNCYNTGYVILLTAEFNSCEYDSNGKEIENISKKIIIGITCFKKSRCNISHKGVLRWTPDSDVVKALGLSVDYKEFEPGLWFDLSSPEEVVSGVLNFNLLQNGLEECVDNFEIILK